jgi:hypothetical protein
VEAQLLTLINLRSRSLRMMSSISRLSWISLHVKETATLATSESKKPKTAPLKMIK